MGPFSFIGSKGGRGFIAAAIQLPAACFVERVCSE